MNITILFGNVLSFVMEQFAVGGGIHFIVWIHDTSLTQIENMNIGLVTKYEMYNCKEFTFHLSGSALDVIFLIDCEENITTGILQTVSNAMCSYKSILARPNVIVVSVQAVSTKQLSNLSGDKCGGFTVCYASMKEIDNEMKFTSWRIAAESSQIVSYCSQTDVSLERPLYQHFKGFRGELLQVTTRQFNAFVMNKQTINGTGTWSGICISLLQTLADILDFRFEIMEADTYGAQENATHWSGMIGLVARQEKDLAVAALTINSQRQEVVDFTVPFYNQFSAVAIKVREVHMFNIFRPLRSEVWLSLLGVSSIFIILSTLTTVMNPRSRSPLTALVEDFWFVVRILLSQSYMKSFYGFASRFCVALFSLGMLIIFSTYKGNMIASLAVQKVSLPIQTLTELAESNYYKLLVAEGSAQHNLLKNSHSAVYESLWKKVQRDKTLCSYSPQKGKSCRELFFSGDRYLRIGDEVRFDFDYKLIDCNVRVLPQKFHANGYGIALPKGSPYKSVFDKIIYQLNGAGFINLWKKQFWPSDKCKKKEDMHRVRSITLSFSWGIFITLACGVTAATIVLMCEICLHRYFSSLNQCT